MNGKRAKDIRRVRDDLAAKIRVNRRLTRWQRFCNWFYRRKETGKMTPDETRRLYQNIKRTVHQFGAEQLSE